jgi:hypothetical protein
MGTLKFKFIVEKDSNIFEEKVNEFIGNPDITVVDKQFAAVWNDGIIWKYMNIWYMDTGNLDFKKVK